MGENPLLEVDKQGGLCRHLVSTQMLHLVGCRKDRTSLEVPAECQPSGFIILILFFCSVKCMPTCVTKGSSVSGMVAVL
jgi:hypothetical protein